MILNLKRSIDMNTQNMGSMFVLLGMILVIWSLNRINRNKKD
jgi:flagellar biogenesis protein FliO